jgi:hypothetical protein
MEITEHRNGGHSTKLLNKWGKEMDSSFSQGPKQASRKFTSIVSPLDLDSFLFSILTLPPVSQQQRHCGDDNMTKPLPSVEHEYSTKLRNPENKHYTTPVLAIWGPHIQPQIEISCGSRTPKMEIRMQFKSILILQGLKDVLTLWGSKDLLIL